MGEGSAWSISIKRKAGAERPPCVRRSPRRPPRSQLGELDWERPRVRSRGRTIPLISVARSNRRRQAGSAMDAIVGSETCRRAKAGGATSRGSVWRTLRRARRRRPRRGSAARETVPSVWGRGGVRSSKAPTG
jgi:hypothetical protein